MKVVTICGSMKFEEQMKSIAFELETKADMCVLQCVYGLDKESLSTDDIDIDIKTGKTNKDLALELFILKK